MTTHITTLITIHSLSHSQIETWEQCPRRWYLEKIARVPRAPAEALVFGTAIHAAIEADGRRIAAGKDPLPLAHLLVAFAEALEAELAKADPWHFLAEQLPDLRLRGLAVLRAYEQSVQPHYHPLEVETDFELPIPSLDGWVFTGRLDALTGRDGVRTIVDFKTGGKPWPAGAEHSKDQATAYVWSDIVNFIQMPNDEATGHLEHVRRRVTFITLPAWRGLDGENYVCAPEFRTTTRGPVQIAHYVVKVHETAAAMTAAMEHGTFPAQTGPLCGWCSCLGSCEIGQTWLRERGRTPAVPVITPDMATVERAPAMDQRWTSDGPAMDQQWR